MWATSFHSWQRQGQDRVEALEKTFQSFEARLKKDLTVVGTYLLEEDKILSIWHEGWQELAWNPGDVREQA